MRLIAAYVPVYLPISCIIINDEIFPANPYLLEMHLTRAHSPMRLSVKRSFHKYASKLRG